MNKEIKLNTIVWLALVVLIVLSSIFAETGFKYSYTSISAFAVIKFLSVCFQFVEVKNAHAVWKIVTIIFVLSYSIILLI